MLCNYYRRRKMLKNKQYTYLGTNGTITSPVFLENIYSIVKYELIASEGKLLTKDGVNTVHSIIVPENEMPLWYEIESK
jgi:hypothetical protein